MTKQDFFTTAVKCNWGAFLVPPQFHHQFHLSPFIIIIIYQ